MMNSNSRINIQFDEMYFLNFAQSAASEVHSKVKNFYHERFLRGITEIEYAQPGCENLKAEHTVDKFVKEIIAKHITEEYPQLWKLASIYMEDIDKISDGSKKIKLFIDPVDGSRSADMNIGDSCFMMAYGEQGEEPMRFKDLKSCYIRGLKTGDTYFTYQSKAYYIPGGHTYGLVADGTVILDNGFRVMPLTAKTEDGFILKDASVIIRDGYGMRNIVSQKINHDVLNQVKHSFSFDITGSELCYLAAGRGIVHILVEARKHRNSNRKQIGSDGYNLIPYPLVRAAGAMVYTLNGSTLENLIYDPSEIYDFIACSNEKLLKEFIDNGVRAAI